MADLVRDDIGLGKLAGGFENGASTNRRRKGRRKSSGSLGNRMAPSATAGKPTARLDAAPEQYQLRWGVGAPHVTEKSWSICPRYRQQTATKRFSAIFLSTYGTRLRIMRQTELAAPAARHFHPAAAQDDLGLTPKSSAISYDNQYADDADAAWAALPHRDLEAAASTARKGHAKTAAGSLSLYPLSSRRSSTFSLSRRPCHLMLISSLLRRNERPRFLRREQQRPDLLGRNHRAMIDIGFVVALDIPKVIAVIDHQAQGLAYTFF